MTDADPRTVPLHAAPDALSLPGATLEVLRGPDAGRSAALSGRTLRVGTAADNDLVLSDPSVSRHHLELQVGADGVWIVDHESTNGTFAAGVRIARALATDGLLLTVGGSELRFTRAASPVTIPRSSRESFGGLVGRSGAMRELYALLERVAPTDASVLLHGETGTGKELAAEAIHDASARAKRPFVIVDCGAIPPALFESELFGHVRGAFTGAVSDRTGLLVEANGGTVFLDEIGELAPELQPKLLRAIERRQVRPVGASRAVDVDVRVIAATHRDLVAEVNRGAFREDLYFRLAVVRLTLPPLRERREDVPALVRLFVDRLAPARASEAGVIAESVRHRSFPGNVRELRNAVEEHLVLGLPARPAARAGAPSDLPDELFSLAYEEASALALRRFQDEYVTRLLARTSGNVSQAAREAGMSRRYLQTILRRLGLGADG